MSLLGLDVVDIGFCLGLLVGNILVRVIAFQDTILSGAIVGLIASIIFIFLKRIFFRIEVLSKLS